MLVLTLLAEDLGILFDQVLPLHPLSHQAHSINQYRKTAMLPHVVCNALRAPASVPAFV